MRKFIIEWQEKVKYGKPSPRKTAITLPKSTKDIGIDAKAALNILTTNYKSLKYIDVLNMQEIDIKTGENIGEPIKPMEDTSIIPVSK